MPVRFVGRPGRLTQVVELAQLMRHARQFLGHGLADRLLAVRDDARDRHWQGLAHLGQQRRQIGAGGGEQAPGQEDFARDTVAENPENLVTDIGLQAIDGQDDTGLLLQQPLQPLRISGRQGRQFVVALQEIEDGALGEDDAAASEFVVDLGDAAVFAVA